MANYMPKSPILLYHFCAFVEGIQFALEILHWYFVHHTVLGPILIPGRVDLLVAHEFVGCEGVGQQVCAQTNDEEVNLGCHQADGEDAHHRAVQRPQLRNDVANELAVRQVGRLVVLYGVLQPWHDGIREEVAHARIGERCRGEQKPLVPGVYAQGHELAVRGRPKRHERGVHEAHALQKQNHGHHPHHQKDDGHSLVVEKDVEASHGISGRHVNTRA